MTAPCAIPVPGVTVRGVRELSALVGRELEPTPWLTLAHDRLETFEAATFDGPSTNFPGAHSWSRLHGTHTLALLVPLWERTVAMTGFTRIVLYGCDRVRFPASVEDSARVRGRFSVAEVSGVRDASDCRVAATLEVEGATKPACVAELVFRLAE